MKKINLIIIISFLTVNTFCQDKFTDGNCVEGNCIEGKGKFIFHDGDEYEGYYSSGKRNGEGTYIYNRGDAIYTGSWKNNWRHGQGTMKFLAGSREGENYTGKFVDDLPNGKGVWSYSNGDKFEGLFLNAKRTGIGTLIKNKNGIKNCIGYYSENEIQFPATINYQTGEKYEGFWDKNYKKDGEGTLYKSSETWKGSWKNDVLVDGWIIYANCSQVRVINGEKTKTKFNSTSSDCSCIKNIRLSDEITQHINRRIDTLQIRLNNKKLLTDNIINTKYNEIVNISIHSYNMALKIVEDAISDLYNMAAEETPFDILNKSFADIVWDTYIKEMENYYGSEIKSSDKCLGEGASEIYQEYLKRNGKIGEAIAIKPIKEIANSVINREEIIRDLRKEVGDPNWESVNNPYYDNIKLLQKFINPCLKARLKSSGLKYVEIDIFILDKMPELGIIVGNTFANSSIQDDIQFSKEEYENLRVNTITAIGILEEIKEKSKYETNSVFDICSHYSSWLSEIYNDYNLLYKDLSDTDIPAREMRYLVKKFIIH